MAEKNPIVTIVMNDGDVMKLELYPEVAENTVNNFISLVNKGFYDGLTFHRIISGFMIHGGLSKGSAGCIDIPWQTGRLSDFLDGCQESVPVYVRYIRENW